MGAAWVYTSRRPPDPERLEEPDLAAEPVND
jgi:hypothetical protein